MTFGDETAAVPQWDSPSCPSGDGSADLPHDEACTTPDDDLLRSLAQVEFVLGKDSALFCGADLDALTAAVESEACGDIDYSSADSEVYSELAEAGFMGPAWDEVIAEPLIRNGHAVLTAWLRNGWIFKVLRDNNVRLQPPASGAERRRLAAESQLQQELVHQSVAAALAKFQRELQSRTGWNPLRGRSMKSYFISACVLAFGNEFRKWRRREQILRFARDEQSERLDATNLVDLGYAQLGASSTFADPETTAIANAMIRDAFAPLSPVERVIVLSKAWGYTAAEIAELYPEITKKAVEQRWDRLKAKHEWVNRLSDMVRRTS